jgi:hypothetical protein
VTDTLEHTARRIADRGRDELIARLRPAFEEAASAHADVLQLDDEQLEKMIQRAADRADGLQWRRALAAVATQELGIGLGEALTHPAVARAQAIVGAPSYEESLAALGQGSAASETDQNGSAPVAAAHVDEDRDEASGGEAPAGEGEASGELQAPAVHDVLREDEAFEDEDVEDEAFDEEEFEDEDDEEFEDEDEDEFEDEDDEPDGPLRIAAVHLGGIANLAPAEAGLELRLSDAGLDIARGEREVLGRLPWNQLTALEVPDPKGFRRRRKVETHLVVRTTHGDASFHIPALTPHELREHLEPVLARHKGTTR